MVVGRVSEGGMDAVLVVQGVTKAKDEGGIIQFIVEVWPRLVDWLKELNQI